MSAPLSGASEWLALEASEVFLLYKRANGGQIVTEKLRNVVMAAKLRNPSTARWVSKPSQVSEKGTKTPLKIIGRDVCSEQTRTTEFLIGLEV